ncbi:hypothetical protein DAI22_06g165800 [Oryza sativa Japonica Group]|nr:hypothetical protein DAI22_06g165800 [Oryza sativa Japonica Group]
MWPDGDRRPALPCSAATRLVLAAAAREGAEEARRRRRGDFFFLLRDILDDYSALLYLTLETHDLLLTVGSGDRTVLREEPIGRPIALLPRESLLPHKARPDRGSDPTADDAPTSSSPPPPSRSRGCGGLAVHRGWRSPPPPPTATPHPDEGECVDLKFYALRPPPSAALPLNLCHRRIDGSRQPLHLRRHREPPTDLLHRLRSRSTCATAGSTGATRFPPPLHLHLG